MLSWTGQWHTALLRLQASQLSAGTGACGPARSWRRGSPRGKRNNPWRDCEPGHARSPPRWLVYSTPVMAVLLLYHVLCRPAVQSSHCRCIFSGCIKHLIRPRHWQGREQRHRGILPTQPTPEERLIAERVGFCPLPVGGHDRRASARRSCPVIALAGVVMHVRAGHQLPDLEHTPSLPPIPRRTPGPPKLSQGLGNHGRQEFRHSCLC